MSEEIVRWGFEISVNQSRNWFIAFTNPTAGPWKRITAPDSTGKFGEIHRFEIDETRPDLILVNDKTHQVLIVEAKTTFDDLQKPAQRIKTSQLFQDLTLKLQNMAKNRFWGIRSGYEYVPGLLWSSSNETSKQVSQMCRDYLKTIGSQNREIICIEGFFENESIKFKVYNGISGENLKLPN